MIDEGQFEVVTTTVTDQDTAIALGSGDVAVLGTPRVVSLCEAAAIATLAGSLAPGATSVGTSISIDHVAASAVGATVVAKATVTGVEGKKLLFDVELTDDNKVVATGTHTRFIVDRSRFERSAAGPA
jgi:predicted thioesterase